MSESKEFVASQLSLEDLHLWYKINQTGLVGRTLFLPGRSPGQVNELCDTQDYSYPVLLGVIDLSENECLQPEDYSSLFKRLDFDPSTEVDYCNLINSGLPTADRMERLTTSSEARDANNQIAARTEQWRYSPVLPDTYQVSSFGRVRSRNKKKRFQKQVVFYNGERWVLQSALDYGWRVLKPQGKNRILLYELGRKHPLQRYDISFDEHGRVCRDEQGNMVRIERSDFDMEREYLEDYFRRRVWEKEYNARSKLSKALSVYSSPAGGSIASGARSRERSDFLCLCTFSLGHTSNGENPAVVNKPKLHFWKDCFSAESVVYQTIVGSGSELTDANASVTREVGSVAPFLCSNPNSLARLQDQDFFCRAGWIREHDIVYRRSVTPGNSTWFLQGDPIWNKLIEMGEIRKLSESELTDANASVTRELSAVGSGKVTKVGIYVYDIGRWVDQYSLQFGSGLPDGIETAESLPFFPGHWKGNPFDCRITSLDWVNKRDLNNYKGYAAGRVRGNVRGKWSVIPSYLVDVIRQELDEVFDMNNGGTSAGMAKYDRIRTLAAKYGVSTAAVSRIKKEMLDELEEERLQAQHSAGVMEGYKRYDDSLPGGVGTVFVRDFNDSAGKRGQGVYKDELSAELRDKEKDVLEEALKEGKDIKECCALLQCGVKKYYALKNELEARRKGREDNIEQTWISGF